MTVAAWAAGLSRLPRSRLSAGLPSGAYRPGLGIEVDLEAVAQHPFEQELPQRVFYRDGSVGDW